MSATHEIATRYPGLADHVSAARASLDQRLWHQASEHLVPLFNELTDEGLLRALYDDMVRPNETRFNPLTTARFATAVAHAQADPAAGRALIEQTASKLSDKLDAVIMLRTELARFDLQAGNDKSCRDILEECKAKLDASFGIDNAVFSNYYRTYCNYLRVTSKPSEFYRASLLFLAYTPMNTLPVQEQRALAYDIGLSAILGDDIYNFGELLAHRVLESLRGTEAEWLYDLLTAFNSGRMSAYEAAVAQHQAQLMSNELLVRAADAIRRKAQIMSLIELVFQRGTDNRVFSFADIADALFTPADQVEFIVLRALAAGVIKGSIDEVNNSVIITWVQPRVLSKDQTRLLERKFGEWIDGVRDTLNFLERETPEIIQ